MPLLHMSNDDRTRKISFTDNELLTQSKKGTDEKRQLIITLVLVGRCARKRTNFGRCAARSVGYCYMYSTKLLIL